MNGSEYIPHMWLLAGLVLAALELIVHPGIGFLFAGLAGITTGVAVYNGWADYDDTFAQFAWFFGATCIWTLVLWKPMKNLRAPSAGSAGYSDMVGTSAVVTGGGLKLGKNGKVKWSGTAMRARLSDAATAEVIDGTEVTIVAVEGSVLVVEPA